MDFCVLCEREHPLGETKELDYLLKRGGDFPFALSPGGCFVFPLAGAKAIRRSHGRTHSQMVFPALSLMTYNINFHETLKRNFY